MSQCIVIVQFDLPKRSHEQAVQGGKRAHPPIEGSLAPVSSANTISTGSLERAAFIFGRAAKLPKPGIPMSSWIS